jgi:hypothetical protein
MDRGPIYFPMGIAILGNIKMESRRGKDSIHGKTDRLILGSLIMD